MAAILAELAPSMPNQPRSGARHKARMRAVELVFEADARNVPYHEVVAERSVAAGEDESIRPVGEYANTLVHYVGEHHTDIDATIVSKLHDWQLERLPGVDRAILRVAVAEMRYCADTPHAVAIDEAVKIARELSTQDSPAFVHAILSNIDSPQVNNDAHT